MNQSDFDDVVIPPPNEFADIVPLDNVIDTYSITKRGDPELNPIYYVLEEQDNVLNYLNQIQNIKYQIELKVIFQNLNDKDITSDSYRTISLRSNQIIKLGYTAVTEDDLLNVIESFPQQLDSDIIKLIGSGWRIHMFKNIKINVGDPRSGRSGTAG